MKAIYNRASYNHLFENYEKGNGLVYRDFAPDYKGIKSDYLRSNVGSLKRVRVMETKNFLIVRVLKTNKSAWYMENVIETSYKKVLVGIKDKTKGFEKANLYQLVRVN